MRKGKQLFVVFMHSILIWLQGESMAERDGPYRADIDGLRAFAVLSVVFYHAFPNTLSGGFIGVDVFFVISGYLITGIILSKLESGSFSLWNFYQRRILRIFPALLLVLIAVFVFGWFALLPNEYKALGKHIFGGSVFVSNFLFYQESGYFDVTSKFKPLLHLWSLGIEEQFYIIFPFLLLFCTKKYLRIVTVLIIICFMSFFCNIYFYKVGSLLTFYSPLTRFWQIIAGSLLCTFMRSPNFILEGIYYKFDSLCSKILFVSPKKNDGGSLQFCFAILGVALLCFSLLLARETAPWPGWKGLLPTLGTVLLIAAGPNTVINRIFFSNKIAVAIGIVSYPFYLWHWPLISFAYIINGGLPSDTLLLRIALISGAFFLAILTYWIVEKPFRFGNCAIQKKVCALVVCMVCVGVIGLCVWKHAGLPNRNNINMLSEMLHELSPPPPTDEAGIRYANIEKGILSYCRYSDLKFDRTVAVIGDSHALSAYHGIKKLGKQLHFNTVLLGWFVPNGHFRDADAAKQIPVVFDVLSKKHDIDKVFIVTRGPLYLTGKHNFTGNVSLTEVEYSRTHRIPRDSFATSLQDSVIKLVNTGKKVYIIAENPELPASPMDYIHRPFRKAKIGGDFPLVLKKDILERMDDYLYLLQEVKEATFINTIDSFCPTSECRVFNDRGLPLYIDDDHLSYAGSIFQAEKILMPYLKK